MNLSLEKVALNVFALVIFFSHFGCGKKKNSSEALPPEYLTTISEFSLSGTPLDIAMYGDYGVIAMGERGLAIVNLKTLPSPVLINEIKVGSDVRRVEVVGDYAVILDALEGVQTVYIKDPNSLSLAGQIGLIEIGDYAHDLLVAPDMPDYMFLATHLNGVRLYDMSSMAHPIEVPLVLSDNLTLVNNIFVSQNAEGVGVRLLTSSYLKGVNIYDVDVANGTFVKLTTLEVDGHPKKITYDKTTNLVYVAALDGGLQVFDVTDLADIKKDLVFNSLDENVTDFALTGSRLIVVTSIEGTSSYTLHVLEKEASSASFRLLESKKRQGQFGSLTIVGDDIIVADALVGITTFRFSDLNIINEAKAEMAAAEAAATTEATVSEGQVP